MTAFDSLLREVLARCESPAAAQMVPLHPSRISDPAECARLVDLALKVW